MDKRTAPHSEAAPAFLRATLAQCRITPQPRLRISEKIVGYCR